MSDDKSIYLDNAATTRVDPDVYAAMEPFFREAFANPATLYTPGREARDAVERARAEVAALVGAAPEEIVFTSGGTESDNHALRAAVLAGERRHIVTSAVEHPAVLETARFCRAHLNADATVLPVDKVGRVDPVAARDALRDDTAVVSIQHGNNEIGTLQDVAALAAAARARGALFHTDAVQTAGKVPLDVAADGIDLLSLSAHKMHGPKGVGALSIRRGTRIESFLRGGGQENGRRAGTLNVPGIVGLGRAAALARERLAESARRMRSLAERLWTGLAERVGGLSRTGDPEASLPHILHVRVDGTEGEALLLELDAAGIRVASGSACRAGSGEASHVLLALGLSPEAARGGVRFSLSRETTEAEIDRALAVFPEAVKRLRSLNPTWKD